MYIRGVIPHKSLGRPEAFRNVLRRNRGERHTRGRRWYRSQFDDCRSNPVATLPVLTPLAKADLFVGRLR